MFPRVNFYSALNVSLLFHLAATDYCVPGKGGKARNRSTCKCVAVKNKTAGHGDLQFIGLFCLSAPREQLLADVFAVRFVIVETHSFHIKGNSRNWQVEYLLIEVGHFSHRDQAGFKKESILIFQEQRQISIDGHNFINVAGLRQPDAVLFVFQQIEGELLFWARKHKSFNFFALAQELDGTSGGAIQAGIEHLAFQP